MCKAEWSTEYVLTNRVATAPKSLTPYWVFQLLKDWKRKNVWCERLYLGERRPANSQNLVLWANRNWVIRKIISWWTILGPIWLPHCKSSGEATGTIRQYDKLYQQLKSVVRIFLFSSHYLVFISAI